MTLDSAPAIVAVTLVTLATLTIGTWGLRFSRTTSDFYVASRSVRPALNASAIGGEYLSAASFLGIAGLVFTSGADMLWYPIGWTAGYLVLLTLVAAPLRRSGAYTLPDFAEERLASRGVRRLCSLLVVSIGWLYLIPQLQGAGLTLELVAGAPRWVGAALVGTVVLVSVFSGGMRSITFVQAFQYWLKLTALLVPVGVLVAVWGSDGAPRADLSQAWSLPMGTNDATGLYATYSLIAATFLGTMGLPHVGVRFYTNPDGRAARRTTLVVLALIGVFYLLPPVLGVLGRVYAATPASADTLVLELPRLMVSGWAGDALTGLVCAGAFAAFLSTSSGLAIAVSGVLSQDVVVPWLRRRGSRFGGVAAFRIASFVAVIVPVTGALLTPSVGVARGVALAFALAAATFCPLLLLGIWWRRLTAYGAAAGLVTGLLTTGAAVIFTISGWRTDTWVDVVLTQPALWTVPLSFAVMILASLATAARVPAHTTRLLVRLHTPEPTVTTPAMQQR
ncbi:Na+(H+)/acetate symporter ActP [Nocardioides albertanoniae]|uniref:Na+(H+)/acetate symporter ActP n=1 Tax=Nocardioides albertanoniae TaxID=1175486 RepID=A0A543ADM2_9ACTN|nr:cation acetate symporter [Nocardioides albertanoniae]TQL70681.1 Na+(H+)/acetate symporter ActP [Nocardioides albertanoniae]